MIYWKKSRVEQPLLPIVVLPVRQEVIKNTQSVFPMEKSVASDVAPPTPETSTQEEVPEVPINQTGAEKGRAEPNEAFFGSLLLFCLALSLFSATGYFGFVGYRYFKRVQTEKAIPSLEALPKAEVVASIPETPDPNRENSAETVAPAADPSTPTVVDRKTLALKVLNGGAAKGVAGTYAEKLKAAGFAKTVVGNTFGDYTGQTLYYAKGQSVEADVIKAEVMKTYPTITVKEASSGDKDALAATYVLILGR